MIDVIVEIDPDISGIDEKKSINILQSTLKREKINHAKINLIFANDTLLNNLKVKYLKFQTKAWKSFLRVSNLIIFPRKY